MNSFTILRSNEDGTKTYDHTHTVTDSDMAEIAALRGIKLNLDGVVIPVLTVITASQSQTYLIDPESDAAPMMNVCDFKIFKGEGFVSVSPIHISKFAAGHNILVRITR